MATDGSAGGSPDPGPSDASPLDAAAEAVPSVGGPAELTLVEGRSFAISGRAGQMRGRTHGLVYDDRRHLSHLMIQVDGAHVETLASSTPTPSSAVTVMRLLDGTTMAPSSCLIVRRRQLGGGMLDDLELRETGRHDRDVVLRLFVAADFAHVFDVKAGKHDPPGHLSAHDGGWQILPAGSLDLSTRFRAEPAPHAGDPETGMLMWRLRVPARGSVHVRLHVVPVAGGEEAPLEPATFLPLGATPERRARPEEPSVVSADPRLAPSVARALDDLDALRLTDVGHPGRSMIAAGAPWYMTLFGRDSLLTALMALPFLPDLAGGVLAELAELQGRRDDPLSEEQPGKILHEVRKPGASGAFAEHSCYYGTVDATPLFVVLAAEAARWGALDDAALTELAPALDAAVGWILREARSEHGFIGYRRRGREGLSNQGWKDSWDGITFVDGSLPEPPIYLVEVQAYAYAALLGAAELAERVHLQQEPRVLRERAERLRDRFNKVFWDARGWFALGVDGRGRVIDSLTTNPGHALWCGIAEPALANAYLDRLLTDQMFSGWGLRTLASSMGAYDPLAYHNGSVWPHDTALCIAGAARYGRWDVVDRLVDGALETARLFRGRPPELFSGLDRAEVPTPVPYPASCSPQAWASASLLMNVRSLLGLEPTADGVAVRRTDVEGLPNLSVVGLRGPRGPVDVQLLFGTLAIEPHGSVPVAAPD
ncbi:glycogen debranching N-terminal domain-containing protein [Georgenia sp. SYP-B2076]|uniref:amylo-alpha-1,6-glucosidase n=1 Tax=Georgenia sp. SYP-B2076 TaxID=2495881 RepID=UPI000F8E52BF|nr:glycogen debranching N-terminal domain-containing protein [Georgenia sp. SYP-B2076]